MLVGGRWAGVSRARAHTMAYVRAYLSIGLVGLVYPPAFVAHLLSLIIVVPGALVANLFFVRLFPRKSWAREPWRGWFAGFAGLMSAWVGTMTWLSATHWSPYGGSRFGAWGTTIYLLSIPVLFSNLGVLIGYLPARERLK
jgi:hypothetical protein